MMKMLMILLTGVLLSTASPAQTWNEWFKQKKTQKKYLIKQIVLLKTYAGYVRKGITVIHHGWTTLENIKNGDFNLHRDFFGHLQNVNPHIKNSAKVVDIIVFQTHILRELSALNAFVHTNRHFTPEEIKYVADVYANMLFLTDASVSELLTIIGHSDVELTDDERIQRIDLIYDEVKEQQSFASSFSDDVHYIAAQREQEQRSVDNIKSNYDI